MALVDFLGIFGTMYSAFYQEIGLVDNGRPIFYHDSVKSLSHISFKSLSPLRAGVQVSIQFPQRVGRKDTSYD